MCRVQIDIVELLDADVRQLEVREKNGQLSAAQQAHIDHLLRSLQAAKTVVKANVMKTGQGVGWMEEKRWIFMQTMSRERVREELHAARDQVVRSAQLLNLSLSVHVVQSMACAAAGDGGESEREDAQQLLDYMQQHQHDSDAQVEAILAQLQQGRQDQARQAERMAAELQRVSQANAGLTLQLERLLAALAKQAAAAVTSPVHSSQSLMAKVPEFVVDDSLRLRTEQVLGRGSGGRVMRAECTRVMGSGVWVECAFKEMIVELPADGDAKARRKAQAKYDKAFRKEAAVMWLLSGQSNILRLYGVCARPLGLVFEYCNKGTLQQWLWAQVQSRDARGRPLSSFISTQRLADESRDFKQGLHKRRADSDDSDDGGDDDGYAQLLSSRKIRGHLSLAQRLLIAQELISAVSHLHSRHLAHGDIKSSNVLVHDLSAGMSAVGSSNSTSPTSASPSPLLCVRLSDFGSAKVQASFTGQLGSTLQGPSAAGGTLRWSAPERLMDDAEAGQAAVSPSSSFSSSPQSADSSSSLQSPPPTTPQSSPEDRSADVYSLSLLLAELFTSLPPYAHLLDAKVYHAMFSRQPPYSDALLDGVSPALRLLVRACTLPLGQRASLAVLKYQLWPDVQAALSGWKEWSAHAPAAPWPAGHPAAVAAPPSSSADSGKPMDAHAGAAAHQAPPLPARPRARPLPTLPSAFPASAPSMPPPRSSSTSASPSAAGSATQPSPPTLTAANAAPVAVQLRPHNSTGAEQTVTSPAASLDLDDVFTASLAAFEQLRATARIPATPSMPPAPIATHPTPAPVTPSMIDGGKEALQLQYHHDGDECGLFYHLGTRGGVQPWKNPCTAGLVTVTCSALDSVSHPCAALVSRDMRSLSTKGKPESWFCIDLHSACFQLSHYTLKSDHLQSWQLEASNEGGEWDVLDSHSRDDTLKHSNKSRHTWSVPQPASRWHRYFRIKQTEANRNGNHCLYLFPMELYGALLSSASHAAAPSMPPPRSSSTSASPSAAASAKRPSPLTLTAANAAPVAEPQLSRNSTEAVQLHWDLFSDDSEQRGLFHYLATRGGSQPWKNPCEAGLVSLSCSSLSPHSEPCSALLEQYGVGCTWNSKDEPQSWLCLDLHSATLQLSHYAFISHELRSWQLEGSRDGETWHVLDTRRKEDRPHTWRVYAAQGGWYGHFRLQQTGPNWSGRHHLRLFGIELYGTLLPSASHAAAQASPSQASSSYSVIAPTPASAPPNRSSSASAVPRVGSSFPIPTALTKKKAEAGQVVQLRYDSDDYPGQVEYLRYDSDDDPGQVEQLRYDSDDDPGQVVQLRYDSDDDHHGLFYHLGTRGGTVDWQNPDLTGLVTVTASSLDFNSQPCSALIDRGGEGRYCCTADKAQSWFLIDLHRACFQLSHYTLRGMDSYAPRDWQLTARGDGEQWDVLDEHSDDTTLERSARNRHTWSVQLSASAHGRWYRYIRIQQTGLNCSGDHRFGLWPIKLYGALLAAPAAQSAAAQPSASHAAASSSSHPVLSPSPASAPPARSSSASASSPHSSSFPAAHPPTPPPPSAATKPTSTAADSEPGVLQLRYHHDDDENGLLYYLGTHGPARLHHLGSASSALPWHNPVELGMVSISSSSQGSGKPCSLLADRRYSFDVCSTKDKRHSWFCVDLRSACFRLSHYTLRSRYLRHWRLQGSADGEQWWVLDERSGERGVEKGYQRTWPVQHSSHSDSPWHRYFRLEQMGENSMNSDTLLLSDVELYGALLLSAVSPPPPPPQPTVSIAQRMARTFKGLTQRQYPRRFESDEQSPPSRGGLEDDFSPVEMGSVEP